MDEYFVVRHSQRFLAGTLALIAFVAWTTQGLTLTHSFLAAGSQGLELCAWILVGAVLLGVLLWLVFGRKKVRIRDGELSVGAEIFGLSFYQSEPLTISDAKDLRVEKYGFGYKGKTVTRYRLTVELGGAQRDLLSDLSETQANALMRWGPLEKLLKSRAQ